MPTPPPSGATPESLFAIWLARREAGEQPDLEALCAEHPDLAVELRELQAQWSRLERIRRAHGL